MSSTLIAKFVSCSPPLLCLSLSSRTGREPSHPLGERPRRRQNRAPSPLLLWRAATPFQLPRRRVQRGWWRRWQKQPRRRCQNGGRARDVDRNYISGNYHGPSLGVVPAETSFSPEAYERRQWLGWFVGGRVGGGTGGRMERVGAGAPRGAGRPDVPRQNFICGFEGRVWRFLGRQGRDWGRGGGHGCGYSCCCSAVVFVVRFRWGTKGSRRSGAPVRWTVRLASLFRIY